MGELGKSSRFSLISTSVVRPKISKSTFTRSLAGINCVTVPVSPLKRPESAVTLSPIECGLSGISKTPPGEIKLSSSTTWGDTGAGTSFRRMI